MKVYQKFIIIGVWLLIIMCSIAVSGRKTTRAVYLWNEDATEQLAEIDRGSLVLQIREENQLDYVFYIKGFKFGYIKNEYLNHIFQYNVDCRADNLVIDTKYLPFLYVMGYLIYFENI